MRDRYGDDFAAVRAADLAAASAVVVRFRRRRRATVAAALSVGLAAMLSSRPFYAPSTSSLVPTTEAPPTTTASPGGTASPSPAPTRPVTTPAAPAGPGVAATRPGPAVVPPSPVPRYSRPSRPAAPPAEAPRRASRVPVVRSEDGTGCNDVPLAAVSTALCMRAEAIQQKRGGAVSLRYTACRNGPRLSDVTLRFATTKEVEFVVVRDGAIIWRWSTGVRFTKSSHSVPVADCVRWRTLWNGRLDDGTRVPSGRYAIRAAGRDSDDVLYGAAADFTVSY